MPCPALAWLPFALTALSITFPRIQFVHAQRLPLADQASSPSLMNLISPRDIAELTQVATQFAAQTFRSNGEVLSKSGPEVQPVNLDAHPSEIIGQSLTNMMSPGRQGLANALRQPVPLEGRTTPNTGTSLIEQLAGSFLGGKAPEAAPPPDRPGPRGGESLMGMDGMVSQAMRLLSGGRAPEPNAAPPSPLERDEFLQTKRQSNGLPTLNQFFPGADKNFGFRQGEGCVPFIGEFMKMAYGNCVKRADEQTWDTWGKEISHALMGGKIDLLRASKETCKMGAEREHCGQLRRAISECDILGSIQMATNLQRSVSRCNEVTGIMDQNPSTMLTQMNGLINGELAQGFLNNFLG